MALSIYFSSMNIYIYIYIYIYILLTDSRIYIYTYIYIYASRLESWSGFALLKKKGKTTKSKKIKSVRHHDITCASEMCMLYEWYLKANAFSININWSYSEELLVCLSSYTFRLQKPVVAPGKAVPPKLPKQWNHPWLVANENRVRHLYYTFYDKICKQELLKKF